MYLSVNIYDKLINVCIHRYATLVLGSWDLETIFHVNSRSFGSSLRSRLVDLVLGEAG